MQRGITMAGVALHHYHASVVWTGNTGRGTADYRAYSRAHEVRVEGKSSITGSSDPQFRGDAARWNPEELLVASLSACHMLWFLHLCADAGIVVTEYVDAAEGFMNGSVFEQVTLKPQVKIAAGDAERATELHEEAHKRCFIANSVKFPVKCEASVAVQEVSSLQP